MESKIGSGFVLVYVHLLYYECHKINTNHRGSYIDSPDWIKSRKATINPINKKDNKCFQHAVTVVLNYKEIGKHSERNSEIKPFINKYSCKEINFPSEKCTAYVSKNKSNPEKQVILLMIPNGEKYDNILQQKKLSALKKYAKIKIFVM